MGLAVIVHRTPAQRSRSFPPPTNRTTKNLMQSINWPLTLTNTITENAGLMMFLPLVWFIASTYSAWGCLNKSTGIDPIRGGGTSVWLPGAGIIFFWQKGADENRSTKAYKGVDAL